MIQQNERKLIFRAGTIPYIIEDSELKMLFMTPSNPEFGGTEETVTLADGTETQIFVARPQIAKGKIEEGETPREAALREAKEEIGLFYGNTVLVEEVGTFMGRTTVFVAKVKDKDMFGLPGDETGEVMWMTESQFLEEGRDLHKPVVQAACRLIRKVEQITES